MSATYHGKTRVRGIGLAIFAVAVAICAKFALTTGELLPGVDGAYYWVQVRSVHQDFTLAFEDLPLIFWVQALLAALVGDIKLGVRISDAVLPALSAIPIYFLLRKSNSIWVPLFGILAVLLHPIQLYFFTGDFIKNSASIPALFFIGLILYQWESRSRLKSLAWLILALVVLALTHFGTLLVALLIAIIWLLVQLRDKPRRFFVTALGLTSATLGLVLIALWVLVPARLERLFEFVSQPSVVFANPAWASIFSPVGGILFGGSTNMVMAFTMISGQIGSVVLGISVWKFRKNLGNSELGLATSAIVSTFFLSSPLLGIEWAYRLTALSFAPLALAAMVVWLAIERPSARVVPAILAIFSILCSAALSSTGPRPPVLSDGSYQDLQVIAKEFDFPDNSIVIARHGLEFLAAWDFQVHVLDEQFYGEVDLGNYKTVFFLEQFREPGSAGYLPSPPYGSNYYMPIEKRTDFTSQNKGKQGYGPYLDSGSQGLNPIGEVVYENASFALRKVR